MLWQPMAWAWRKRRRVLHRPMWTQAPRDLASRGRVAVAPETSSSTGGTRQLRTIGWENRAGASGVNTLCRKEFGMPQQGLVQTAPEGYSDAPKEARRTMSWYRRRGRRGDGVVTA